jgi:hypothetical protein
MGYNRFLWRLTVRNGVIPRHKLAQVVPMQYDIDLGGPALMHPEAAAAMSALLDQAPEGLRVKYAYRTLGTQWEKWHNYQAGGNLAAYPGTSNHGYAVSVDFTGMSWPVIAWLKNNARRFGYVNDVPSEIWHYTYQGGFKGDIDDMTPEQKRQLKEALAVAREADLKVDQIITGMSRFLMDHGEPPREGLVRRTWRAFTKAAR